MRLEVLPTHTRVKDAVEAVTGKTGLEGSFRKAFTKRYGHPPSSFTRRSSINKIDQEDLDASIDRLMALLTIGDNDVVTICNALQLYPAAVIDLANAAISRGEKLEVLDNIIRRNEDPYHINYKPGVTTMPACDNSLVIGVMSDLHFGSIHCNCEAITAFVEKAYTDYDVRKILICGDLLDGAFMYRGHSYELIEQGMDAQIDTMLAYLPEKAGLLYYFITGNHEASFEKSCGTNVGSTIVKASAENNRTDFNYLGSCEALVKINSATIKLKHPTGAPGMTLSLKLQKTINSMPNGEAPDILLMGHYHRYIKIRYKGVYGLEVGTFQTQTPYMRDRDLYPEVGGCVLDIEFNEDGSIKSLMDYFICADNS